MKTWLQLDHGAFLGCVRYDDAAPSHLPEGRSFVAWDGEPPPIGSTVDAEQGTFTPPPPPPDYGRTVGARDFMLLFTSAQRKAIRQLSKTDDDVADFMAIAQVPEPIRLKHPLTLAGLEMLVQKGALTSPERDRIADGRAA